MKKTIIITISFFLLGVLNSAFGGLVIGSDVYFTSSLEYDMNTDVNATGKDTWLGKNTYLYLGLYPIFSDKLVKGDAKIFVNSSNAQDIYFGGVKVTGYSPDKNFEATAFAMSPALGLTDPMASGRSYGGYVYTSPIAMGTIFADGSNTVKYPVAYNEKFMNDNNYELGGKNGVGLMTKAHFINGLIGLEDYICWTYDNVDTFGALLTVNIPIGDLGIQVGGTAELLKYKASKDFFKYNGYYLSDVLRMLPSQTTFNEDGFVSYGGLVNVDVLGFANVFGQIKMGQYKATTADSDATNRVNEMKLMAGVMSKYFDGTITEIDFAMFNDNNPTDATMVRNGFDVKAKAYGAIDFEVFGMELFYLLDGSYYNQNDGIKRIKSYESISLGSGYTNASGIDLRGSLKFKLFYMFQLRQMLRYATANLNDLNKVVYVNINQIESRTYVDVDLEDLTPGLWTTVGIRLVSYDINGDSSVTISTGKASYIHPYAEIRYVFGEDSFLRLSYGVGEVFGVLADAYGLGYDYSMMTGTFGTTTGGDLYQNNAYNMQYNQSFNFEVAMKL